MPTSLRPELAKGKVLVTNWHVLSPEPDVIVVLEIKGRSHEDTDVKHQAARRWVSAVNHWGRLGEWDFLVCRNPQSLDADFAKLMEVS